MKRSDEARRLDKLYDRLHSKDERIKELEDALEKIRIVPRNFKSGMTYAKRLEVMIDIAEQVLKG